jgi:uncharacterized protein YbbC (DUF1343 family)
MSAKPLFENKICYGLDLREVIVKSEIDLHYLINLYGTFPDKEKFFNGYFDTLAGNATLKQQIKQGLSESEIRQTWEEGLGVYREMRNKYLLYP